MPRTQPDHELLVCPLLVPLLAAAPSDRDNTVIVPSLKRLVFVASPKEIEKAGIITEGISVSVVPMLNHSDFQRDLAAYLDKTLTFKGLNEITAKVSAFYKRATHPLVDVVALQQDVSSGVILIVVNEFRVGEARVQGNRRFYDKVVAAPITLRHGDTIDTQLLLGEVDAANANPFPRVDLIYEPAGQGGYTDFVLNTQDRFPLPPTPDSITAGRRSAPAILSNELRSPAPNPLPEHAFGDCNSHLLGLRSSCRRPPRCRGNQPCPCLQRRLGASLQPAL
jgi:hypothetical protein